MGTYSLHTYKALSENLKCQIHRDMSGSRYAFEHCLNMLIYHEMTEELQEYVAQQLLEVF